MLKITRELELNMLTGLNKSWKVRVHKSTITRILQSKEERLTTEITIPEAKRHKSVVASST